MRMWQNGGYTPEYLALRERTDAFHASRGPTKPFEVGKTYKRHDGVEVTCVEVKGTKGYETARFSDSTLRWYFTGGWPRRDGGSEPVKWHVATTGWRYNRDEDRGRVTGTEFDHSDPRCVIPESAD
jgi:hypothetical protein